MLTKERLKELGFVEMRQQGNWYMELNQFCLLPAFGVWILGSNFGKLGVGAGGILTYIETEEQLMAILENG